MENAQSRPHLKKVKFNIKDLVTEQEEAPTASGPAERGSPPKKKAQPPIEQVLSIDSEEDIAVLKNKLLDKVIIKIRNKKGKK